MHYFIVICIILVIIIFQIYSYLDTHKKIIKYKTVFPKSLPGSSSDYLIEDTFIDSNGNIAVYSEEVQDEPSRSFYDVVKQIRIKGDNTILKKIQTALNSYLRKNKGAASDFHLMKDVVERYCDAEEEEITTQQPIPLYLGLLGTIVGIIVGIGSIAFSGGLGSTTLMDNINNLMVCVAIAMAASFFGVACTTGIAWESKKAFSKIEDCKNAFYSWLQTELLPVLSGNAVNEIRLLQQNLSSFNSTFGNNVKELDAVLKSVYNTTKEQSDLLKIVQDIDVAESSKANVKVLKELKGCVGEIANFNVFLNNVEQYLEHVRALNDKLDQNEERTLAIVAMGEFFQKEIGVIKTRDQQIKEAVAYVDRTLKDSFNDLHQSSTDNLAQFKTDSGVMVNNLRDALKEQKTFLDDISKEISDYAKQQMKLLEVKSKEIDAISNDLKSLSTTKEAMERIASSAEKQNAKLESLITVVRSQTSFARNSNVIDYDNQHAPHNPDRIVVPKMLRIVLIVSLILFLLASGFSVYDFIDKRLSSNSENETTSYVQDSVPTGLFKNMPVNQNGTVANDSSINVPAYNEEYIK